MIRPVQAEGGDPRAARVGAKGAGAFENSTADSSIRLAHLSGYRATTTGWQRGDKTVVRAFARSEAPFARFKVHNKRRRHEPWETGGTHRDLNVSSRAIECATETRARTRKNAHFAEMKQNFGGK